MSLKTGLKRAVQTAAISGTEEEVEAQVAAIKAKGGTLITVRIVKKDAHSDKPEMEITHT